MNEQKKIIKRVSGMCVIIEIVYKFIKEVVRIKFRYCCLCKGWRCRWRKVKKVFFFHFSDKQFSIMFFTRCFRIIWSKRNIIDLHVQLGLVYRIVMPSQQQGKKQSNKKTNSNYKIEKKNVFNSVRDQLHTIVYRYPPTYALTSEEQDIVWKFRFYLSSHEKALTKFLKCINWETVGEVGQALKLLSQWKPMDVEDALELLSPTFTHPAVRR